MTHQELNDELGVVRIMKKKEANRELTPSEEKTYREFYKFITIKMKGEKA